jgi:hypothetical protein
MLFKNSVRTSKRTPYFTITEINWLTLFKFNPLKPKLVQMLFKNSVRTSKRTPHFTITKINWLTLFKFNDNKPVGGWVLIVIFRTGLGVLTAVKMLVLWVVTPCTVVSRYQRFGEHTSCIFRPDDVRSMFF